MKKLADISSFESLSGNNSPTNSFVFNQLANGPELNLYNKIDWNSVRDYFFAIDSDLVPAVESVWSCYVDGCEDGYYSTGDIELKMERLEDALQSLVWAREFITSYYDSIAALNRDIKKNLHLTEELLDMISVSLREDCADVGLDYDQFI